MEMKFFPIGKFKKFRKDFRKLVTNIGVFEILLGIVFLMVLGWLFVNFKTKEERVRVEVKVSGLDWWHEFNVPPPSWLADVIQKGDKEFSSSGKLLAEVTGVRTHELSHDGPQRLTRKDAYLDLILLVDKDKKTSKLKFKNKYLEIGAPIELHLTSAFVPGRVIFVEGLVDERESEELVIKGAWLNVFPWQAEAIPLGGKQEVGGEIIAEITEKRIEEADMIVTTDDGRVLVRKNPLKREVYLTVKIMAKKQGENFYFHEEQKVKVGENIFIQLPGIDVDWIAIVEIFGQDGNKLY